MQTATTLTPEQVELRKGRITSTRIVKLVQGKALDVFNDMMGIAPPFVDSARPRWGRRLERAIIDGAAEERGWKDVVYQPGTIVPAFDARLATSPDALVSVDRVIEAKNRGADQARNYAADEATESEIIQTAWHMGVTARDRGTICVLVGGNDLHLFDVEHDDELWAGLVEIAHRFLRDHIQTRRPPPLDGSDAAADYLRAAFPMNRTPLREDPEAAELVRSYKAACAACDAAEGAKKLAGNLLRERIGEAEGIAGQGWKATWKASKGSRATDWEAVARELAAPAEVVAKFTTERPGARRLLVTVKEG